MKPLLLALGFLTRLPVPRVASGDFATAIRWYPAVGLVIGAILAAVALATAPLGAAVAALAVTAAWAWVTGALHLDGLADVADGLGAAHGDRERLLKVMASPEIGAFGVVALVLQLAAKLVLLAQGPVIPAIILVPALARVGPLVWARWLPPLRARGLGAAVAGAARWRDVAGWGALALAAAAWMPALLAAPVLIAAVGWWLRVRLGGVTGDAHGAGIELVETGLLAALVVARHL